MAVNYNLKNPGVKRIMQEARELAQENCYEYEAHPLEDNIFEWHFTVRGPGDTEFENGRYHGRILLPTEYPFKPPELIFLTPNGRFELNTKVCLSITGFHPEYWQPAWGIRTVILAVMGFFPTEARGAIGGLSYSKEERRILAEKSNSWCCPVCKVSNRDALSDTAPRSQIQLDENMPQFSLTYKPDKQSSEEQPAATSNTYSSNPPASEKSSNSEASVTKETTPTAAPSATNEPETLIPRTTPAPSDATRPATVQPVAAEPSRRTATRPPSWLDYLILSLVVLASALITRRFVS